MIKIVQMNALELLLLMTVVYVQVVQQTMKPIVIKIVLEYVQRLKGLEL